MVGPFSEKLCIQFWFQLSHFIFKTIFSNHFRNHFRKPKSKSNTEFLGGGQQINFIPTLKKFQEFVSDLCIKVLYRI